MTRRLGRFSRAAIAFGIGSSVTLVPAAANAAVATSCTFDAGTATVTATVGSSESATLERSGDEIRFAGAQCGTADVTNTDTITLSAPDDTTSESLTISLSGGPFEPGKTVEADNSNEIEMTVDIGDEDALAFEGSAANDRIEVDIYRVDLTPDGRGEAEVTFPSLFLAPITLRGGGGDDELVSRYYAGEVDGGPGRDYIRGEINQPARFDGGAGRDRILLPDPNGNVVTWTTSDTYQIQRSGATDIATSIETLVGDTGRDVFFGGSDPVRFVGRSGNDIFGVVGSGAHLVGGQGSDLLSYARAPSSVVVDMTLGRSVGPTLTDVFEGIELLEGTSGDDVFVGDPVTAGIVDLAGGDGHDVLDMRPATHAQRVYVAPTFPTTHPSWVRLIAQSIRIVRGGPIGDRVAVGTVNGIDVRARFFGNGGNDRLIGGEHHDVIYGGPGDDYIDGQPGRDICGGGTGSDTILDCEV